MKERVVPNRSSANLVVFLGHAGIQFEYQGVRLLCDPWFSKHGAMLRSWHQWPDNGFVLEQRPELLEPDFIWISHEHSDHFDQDFLRRVDKSAVVILARFPSLRLMKQVRKLGFANIELLDDFQTLSLSTGFEVTMVLEKPDYSEHSSLGVRCGSSAAFHNSDSLIQAADLARVQDTVQPELYIGQYSVTSPFPEIMTGWSEAQKIPARKRHLSWALDRFTNSVKATGARVAIPCAGPAVILAAGRHDAMRAKITHEEGALNYKFLQSELEKASTQAKICFLDPGMEFDLLALADADPELPQAELLSAEEVLAGYSEIIDSRRACVEPKTVALDGTTILPRHEEMFSAAAVCCPFLLEKLDRRFSVYFSDTDERIDTLFLARRELRFELCRGRAELSVAGSSEVADGLPPTYEISIESQYWYEFLTGDHLFDEIFYSQRQAVAESEGAYSSDLINLLRAIHDSRLMLRLNEEYLKVSRETIEVEYQGERYRIKKYCPHMGICLEGLAPSSEGVIECSGHNWQFDVVTGRCLSHDASQSIKPDHFE